MNSENKPVIEHQENQRGTGIAAVYVCQAVTL